MKVARFITSSCRYCRYYQSQGRRGGTCQQFDVPVEAHWSACALAACPFNGEFKNEWRDFREVIGLHPEIERLPVISSDDRDSRESIAL